jgi:mRNA-degrading endonuclease toxin of MazEF toxin-antitoxin module
MTIGINPRHGATSEQGHVVTRGEIWLAEVGRKIRPVLVLTRDGVIDVRLYITVAEVSTSIRGIGAEVALDCGAAGLGEVSVINCDGLHTMTRRCGPCAPLSRSRLGVE